MSPANLQDCVVFAQKIMGEAGKIALSYFRQPLAVSNKITDGFDPVTLADQKIESYLRSRLQERFPEYGVLGEEEGFSSGTGDTNWIIDPIDGTKAFISGIPTWGMLLGLYRPDRALLGIMQQPFLGELYLSCGENTFLSRNGQQLQLKTRKNARLTDAILYCTHESMFVAEENLAAFRRVSAKARLERFGADCYAYAMLAHGLVDLVIEDTLQPYDIIPLIPIIEGAGGVVTDKEGRSPLQGGFVIAAANAELHKEAMDIIVQGC